MIIIIVVVIVIVDDDFRIKATCYNVFQVTLIMTIFCKLQYDKQTN